MEKEKIVNIKILIGQTQINNLRSEIAAVQDQICPDEMSTFENTYPTLFELWSLLD